MFGSLEDKKDEKEVVDKYKNSEVSQSM